MLKIAIMLLAALLPASGQEPLNACDVVAPWGAIDTADVQAIINMVLGITPCTANINGIGVCTAVTVQRVINAELGDACIVNPPHSTTLSWVASVSPNVTGYNVFRSQVSRGPYTKINDSLVAECGYIDSAVQAGVAYYYVVTAVDTDSHESVYSNQASAVIPAP